MDQIRTLLQTNVAPYWNDFIKELKLAKEALINKILSDLGYKIGDTFYTKTTIDNVVTITRRTILDIHLDFNLRNCEDDIHQVIDEVNSYLNSSTSEIRPDHQWCWANLNCNTMKWMFDTKGNYISRWGGDWPITNAVIEKDGKFTFLLYSSELLLSPKKVKYYINKLPKELKDNGIH